MPIPDGPCTCTTDVVPARTWSSAASSASSSTCLPSKVVEAAEPDAGALGADPSGSTPRRRKTSVPVGRRRGVGVEEVCDQLVDVLGKARHEMANVRGTPVSREALQGMVEGQAATGGLEERHADAVPIDRGRHLFPADLLGRHVSHRAGETTVFGLRPVGESDGEPEVEEDQTSGVRDHHVRRLDVAMELHARVYGGDREHELPGHVAKDPVVDPAALGPRAQVRGELQARDELHGEEADALVGEELVEVDEVRVPDVGEGAKLLFQVIEIVRGHSVQRLEGDVGGELGVVRAVDDPHPPIPEPRQDAKPRRDQPERRRAMRRREDAGALGSRPPWRLRARPDAVEEVVDRPS